MSRWRMDYVYYVDDFCSNCNSPIKGVCVFVVFQADIDSYDDLSLLLSDYFRPNFFTEISLYSVLLESVLLSNVQISNPYLLAMGDSVRFLGFETKPNHLFI